MFDYKIVLILVVSVIVLVIYNKEEFLKKKCYTINEKCDNNDTIIISLS